MRSWWRRTDTEQVCLSERGEKIDDLGTLQDGVGFISLSLN